MVASTICTLNHDIPITPVVMAPTEAKAIVDALIDNEVDIAVISIYEYS